MYNKVYQHVFVKIGPMLDASSDQVSPEILHVLSFFQFAPIATN